nr:MAG TPA: hypothetical protein [Bacteriophage sp.]
MNLVALGIGFFLETFESFYLHKPLGHTCFFIAQCWPPFFLPLDR